MTSKNEVYYNESGNGKLHYAGELVNLDIGDINFEERECVVLGKGDKERIVYFDARATWENISDIPWNQSMV